MEDDDLHIEEELSEAERETIAERIEAQIAELRQALYASAEQAKPVDLDQPIGRLSRMDAIQQQKMAQATRARHQQRLEHLEAARRRLSEEDFGLCRQCEDPIGFRRLEARPEATVCMNCIREAQAQRGGRR